MATATMSKSHAFIYWFSAIVLVIAITGSAAAQQPVKFDSATISGLPARNIGSAVMSGRIAAVDAVHDQGRLTVYAGAASGGIHVSEARRVEAGAKVRASVPRGLRK